MAKSIDPRRCGPLVRSGRWGSSELARLDQLERDVIELRALVTRPSRLARFRAWVGSSVARAKAKVRRTS